MSELINDPATQLKHLVHPWESFKDYPDDSRGFLEGAENIFVVDRDGKKMIDGPAGMWCTQIGYGRQEIAEVMAEQAMKMAYYSPWNFDHDSTTELAAKLAELSPGDLNTVAFTTGGSTAVETALRFMMYYNNVKGRPEKKHIISRDGAYHGSTYLSASCTGKDREKNYFDFETGFVHRLSAPNPYRRPDDESLEDFTKRLLKEFEDKVLELGPEKVGAFIGEPIQASGGVIVPPPGYLKGIRDLCTQYEILFISDEVVTAFGRLGHWFASEDVFGIVPDIITTAKGITSGYFPMGATLISDRLIEEISGDQAKGGFYHGFTYSGHPIGCAVALKNIEIMEREKINEHVQALGPYFMQKLEELYDIEIVGDVRGMGLMACVECVVSKGSKNPLKLDKALGYRIDEHCMANGLVVRPFWHMCVMSPPLVITKPQIDRMVKILGDGIQAAQNDLEAEGVWTRPVAAE